MPFVEIGARRRRRRIDPNILAVPTCRPCVNALAGGHSAERIQGTIVACRMPERRLPAIGTEGEAPGVRDAPAVEHMMDDTDDIDVRACLRKDAHPAARRPAVEVHVVHAVREGCLLHGIADHLLPHARRHLVRDEAFLRLRAVVVRAPLAVGERLTHVVPARHLVARRAVGLHERRAARGVHPQRRALEAGRLGEAGVRAGHEVERAFEDAYRNGVARLHGVRRERERTRARLLRRYRLGRREDAIDGDVAVRSDHAHALVVVHHDVIGRSPHEAARR